jgi:hypothetical protein
MLMIITAKMFVKGVFFKYLEFCHLVKHESVRFTASLCFHVDILVALT